MNPQSEEKTFFGYSEIPVKDKTQKVSNVFDSVAPKYDLMNDLMSFGLHRLWKKFALSHSGVRERHKILDVASGTGDLAKAFAKKVGKSGQVILTDINQNMLRIGRERLIDDGIVGNVNFVLANAEALPFPDNFFDCVSIAFGLRNITDKKAALMSINRVLKPGGKALILEFSKPTINLFEKIYDTYSFKVIPKLGQLICGDSASYQYLVESIRMHPNQDALKALMLESGFDDVTYFNLSGGVVALHKGYKY